LRHALAAVGLLLLLLTLPFLPLAAERDVALWNALSNACHLPLFSAVTLVLYAALERSGIRNRLLVAAVVAWMLATGIELLQPLAARSASLVDLLLGALGVALAASGVQAWRTGRGGPRAAHAALAACACLLVLVPAWGEWRAVRWRERHFPVLGAFESDVELRLWRPHEGDEGAPTRIALSSRHVGSGRRSLRVRTGTAGWPGVSYEAGDSDWRPYRTFAFDVYNPGPRFRLHVRIDDAGDTTDADSRYTRGLEVEAGWNRFRLHTADIRRAPARRALDLAHIRRVILFVGRGEPRRVFYVDDARLQLAPAAWRRRAPATIHVHEARLRVRRGVARTVRGPVRRQLHRG
jgi:hypothetical protein